MRSPKNRITTIGLELEGGWHEPPSGFKHDGSVQGLGMGVRAGEVCSPPIKTIEEGEAWLRAQYPQEVNNTCGFHVHVCLPPLHYSRLMDENFNQKFLVSMEDFWNKYRGEPGFDLFRSRLDGQNQYCQKVFRPEQQLWRTEAYGDRNSHPRYSQLNYCFGRHGTMECRLFPCFSNVNHSVEAMKTFVASINEYLATCPPTRPIHVVLSVDELEQSSPSVTTRPIRVSAA